MRIQSLKIEKLFKIFNYNISFKENVLIITGPNGFGKTMILNIIFSLFNERFSFFQKLEFERIKVELYDNRVIEIVKKVNESSDVVTFLFCQNDITIETITISNKTPQQIEMTIGSYLPMHRVSTNTWLDSGTDKVMTLDDILKVYGSQLPDEVYINTVRRSSSEENQILRSIQVYLIKEQRLFKQSTFNTGFIQKMPEQIMIQETIQTFAQELKYLINEYLQQYFLRTQDLDSSYPFRLRDEINVLSEAEYQNKYSLLEQKQLKLKAFGLFDSKQEFPAYSIEDAKALSVYLKDYELKLGVFDDLIQKLELFSSILNERRFTYKSVVINRENGFFFKTSNGKDLTLTQLSSGEQHEVVLLYELIFKVQPNVLVLIDEPEISLHITWQKEFLKDLLKIIALKNIQVVIATHAPAIINDRWDLVYNLQPSA